MPNVTEYNGVIFYHNNSPRWNDTVKVGGFVPAQIGFG